MTTCNAPCDPPCISPVHGRGLCRAHYSRSRRGSRLDTPIYKETREVEQAPPPPPPDWRDKAACKGQDTELFFPNPSDHEAAAWALAWCKACPVVTECLKAELAVEPTSLLLRHGVYGGTLPGDRHSAYRAELYRAERARAA